MTRTNRHWCGSLPMESPCTCATTSIPAAIEKTEVRSGICSLGSESYNLLRSCICKNVWRTLAQS